MKKIEYTVNVPDDKDIYECMLFLLKSKKYKRVRKVQVDGSIEWDSFYRNGHEYFIEADAFDIGNGVQTFRMCR